MLVARPRRKDFSLFVGSKSNCGLTVHHSHVRIYLHTNTRVHIQRDTSAGDFAIGDGAFPLRDSTEFITLTATIGKLTQSLDELIQTVHPNINTNARDTKWLGERVILAPLNSMVNSINSRMVHEFDRPKLT